MKHLTGAFGQFGKRIDDLGSGANANLSRLDARIDRLESEVESRFQWMIGVQVTSWLSLILAIFFKH